MDIIYIYIYVRCIYICIHSVYIYTCIYLPVVFRTVMFKADTSTLCWKRYAYCIGPMSLQSWLLAVTSMVQDGPLPFINGVITPINALVNG